MHSRFTMEMFPSCTKWEPSSFRESIPGRGNTHWNVAKKQGCLNTAQNCMFEMRPLHGVPVWQGTLMKWFSANERIHLSHNEIRWGSGGVHPFQKGVGLMWYVGHLCKLRCTAVKHSGSVRTRRSGTSVAVANDTPKYAFYISPRCSSHLSAKFRANSLHRCDWAVKYEALKNVNTEEF